MGGYTYRLVEALREKDCEVDVFTGNNFKLLNATNLAEQVLASKPDIVHIQYPTAGYGPSLGPQMLSVLIRRCVITLHEVSQVNLLRRLSLYPFSFRTRHIIFTNAFEKDYATKYAPWIARRSSVIPIGSAIQPCDSNQEKDLSEIVYFGLIRPKKGIEEVLTLARLIKLNSLSMSIRIIGMIEPRFQPYLLRLQNVSSDLPVTWNLGLPEDVVSVLLSRSKVAYMPFPDGASERRSSLLALLANDVATVTTSGPFTPYEMNGVVKYAATPAEALPLIKEFLSNVEKRSEVASEMRKYMQRRQWGEIAAAHAVLYQSALKLKS
ncbi:MAG: hypothetical protein ABI479_00670 [Gallionella sp.]